MANAVITDAFGVADAINDIVSSYTKEVTEASAYAVKASAEICRDKIKHNIDKANFKGTGKYRDSWKAEVEEQTSTNTVYRVYSAAPYYRITHLLEKGHLIVVHGHVTGRQSKKFPHIRPAVRDMKKEFGAQLKVGMKK